MKVFAIYSEEVMDDGRVVHAIDHDAGSFIVSSKEVGVAVQNFLHFASISDISILHQHLLFAYHQHHEELSGRIADTSEDKDDAIIAERGEQDGKNAATWMVDGNTDNPYEFLKRIMEGMENIDPEIMDMLPMPRVSGEWADDPTWEQVCMEELDRYGDDGEPHLLDVYETAFHEGVVAEIEAMLHKYEPENDDNSNWSKKVD
jgi:hypothetical protein